MGKNPSSGNHSGRESYRVVYSTVPNPFHVAGCSSWRTGFGPIPADDYRPPTPVIRDAHYRHLPASFPRSSSVPLASSSSPFRPRIQPPTSRARIIDVSGSPLPPNHDHGDLSNRLPPLCSHVLPSNLGPSTFSNHAISQFERVKDKKPLSWATKSGLDTVIVCVDLSYFVVETISRDGEASKDLLKAQPGREQLKSWIENARIAVDELFKTTRSSRVSSDKIRRCVQESWMTVFNGGPRIQTIILPDPPSKTYTSRFGLRAASGGYPGVKVQVSGLPYER